MSSSSLNLLHTDRVNSALLPNLELVLRNTLRYCQTKTYLKRWLIDKVIMIVVVNRCDQFEQLAVEAILKSLAQIKINFFRHTKPANCPNLVETVVHFNPSTPRPFPKCQIPPLWQVLTWIICSTVHEMSVWRTDVICGLLATAGERLPKYAFIGCKAQFFSFHFFPDWTNDCKVTIKRKKIKTLGIKGINVFLLKFWYAYMFSS